VGDGCPPADIGDDPAPSQAERDRDQDQYLDHRELGCEELAAQRGMVKVGPMERQLALGEGHRNDGAGDPRHDRQLDAALAEQGSQP
jgi:hypothetical protein